MRDPLGVTVLAQGYCPFEIECMGKAKKTPHYRQLSVAERLKLVEDIWDSIGEDAGAVPVPGEVLEEAQRRLIEHRRDPKSAIPWDQVKEELFKRGE